MQTLNTTKFRENSSLTFQQAVKRELACVDFVVAVVVVVVVVVVVIIVANRPLAPRSLQLLRSEACSHLQTIINHYLGLMDEVKIFDSILTQEERQALYTTAGNNCEIQFFFAFVAELSLLLF